MRGAPRRSYISAGVAIAGTSLIAVSPAVSPAPHVQVGAAQLTSGDSADSPLGDGTTLVMGGSGIPIPSQRYVDAADALYLQPRGFTGTLQALYTPEGLYPSTGVKSLTADASEAQGQQILDAAIHNQIASGNVDAANPVVVFGYSQSSAIASLTMEQLHNQGVPSDDVHFVLVGDTSAPNGGLLERFDVPAGTDPFVPSLGITFGGATPDNLYPTDIYTLEYDGFADFPQYPIDPLSDPGGHFPDADFRNRDGFPGWESALAESGMQLISERVINEHVLRGLQKNSPRSNELINRYLPAFVRRFGREFAVVDGSWFYRDLERGEIDYRTYCLRKD